MEPVLHLFEPIRDARAFRDELQALGDVAELTLRIHSDGGDILEGFSIYHQLLAHPARVVVEIQVLAASMASVVAMAADEIRLAENGFLVLHNPWADVLGAESEDMRQAATLLDTFKAQAIRAYQRHSSLSAEEISALMDRETWLTADEAVEAGFAHHVTDRIETVGQLSLSRFEHVPEAARCVLSTPQRRPNMSEENETTTPEPAQDPPAETVETLWRRLGQMLRGRPAEPSEPEGTSDRAAVLALEREAVAKDRAGLREDRASLAVERDLGPHKAAIEPARLERVEPLMLRLKTAEMSGDDEAKNDYATLRDLLPKLASEKTGGSLAGSDGGAPKAEGDGLSEARLEVDRRHGLSDERRAELAAKYPGAA